MSYDWLAALASVFGLIGLTLLGRTLAFRVPALQRMRELNTEADRPKLARDVYRDTVKSNSTVGLVTNLAFYVAILPWCVSLESRPVWRHAVDIVVILMVFDFFYYLTHRFLFHGKALRKIHE